MQSDYSAAVYDVVMQQRDTFTDGDGAAVSSGGDVRG